MRLRRWIISIAVVLAVWMAGYAFLSRSPDATAYRQTCVQAAQDAVDGLGTTRWSADAQGDRQLWGTYATANIEDARKMVRTARSSLAAQTPPDDASARLRDEVLPLLDQAERVFEELDAARSQGDTPAQYAAARKMQPIIDALRSFIDKTR